MVQKRWYLYVTLIFLVIGVIHGFFIEDSEAIFFSWLLIGLWMCFTLKFVLMEKYVREFHSPHNTSFFLFGPLLIAILFSMWGYVTGLLQWHIIEDFDYLYLSPWTVIFALPYYFYSMFSLYSCFKKYHIVYLGRKPLAGRNLGIFLTIFIVFVGITISIVYYIGIDFGAFPLDQIHSYPDLLLVLLSIYSFLLLIRYGIFGRRHAVPEVSRAILTRPLQTPTRPRTRTVSSTTTRPRATTTRPSPVRTSSSASSTRTARTKAKPRTQKPTSTKIKSKAQRSQLMKLRPKGAVLSIDDFKCIFCFKLPDVSSDEGRGIVLCPKCKRPAHADEFKDWHRNSPLCSRCEAEISASYRRNPKIISVRLYMKVIKTFSKK